jgi:hypothetical protein
MDDMAATMDGMAATAIAAPDAEKTLVRRRTPSIYVPRRMRIGGLPGVSHGAAIVGTPQGDETVAIDVESTDYVDPNPEIWGVWVAEAARRHLNEDEDSPYDEQMQTMVVSEHELVEIGRYEDGCVLVDDVARARLSMWIEAGRVAYLSEGHVPELT